MNATLNVHLPKIEFSFWQSEQHGVLQSKPKTDIAGLHDAQSKASAQMKINFIMYNFKIIYLYSLPVKYLQAKKLFSLMYRWGVIIMLITNAHHN